MITIVEIVGTPGSGKSTTIRSIPKQPDLTVLTLPAYDGLLPRLRGSLKAAVLSIKYRLSAREALALALNCSTVEVGLNAYHEAESSHGCGRFVIDEGPIRTLGVCSYKTERGLAAWSDYATRTLTKLEKRQIKVVLVKFELANEIYSRRLQERKARMREFEASGIAPTSFTLRRKLNRLSGRHDGPPLNNYNLTDYFDGLAIHKPRLVCRLLELMIKPDESADSVAARLVGLIRSS